MATYDDFLEAIKSSLSQYAKQSWSDYRGQAFIDQAKQDLQTWIQQLVAGEGQCRQVHQRAGGRDCEHRGLYIPVTIKLIPI